MRYYKLLSCLFALLVGCSNSSSSRSTERVGTVPSTSRVGADSRASSTGDPREPLVATMVARMLESEHLRKKPLDDAASKLAFERYIERLDPGKLFLLKEDVDALRKHELQMDDQLHAGKLVLAAEGEAALQKRLAFVEKMVADTLAKPVDITTDEWIETDAEKLTFSQTEDELRERWRKLLKLELLSRIDQLQAIASVHGKLGKDAPNAAEGANGNPNGNPKGNKDASSTKDAPAAKSMPSGPSSKDTPAAKDAPEESDEALREKARKAVATSYEARFARLKQQNDIDHVEIFVNAVASTFDPHTSYLPPAEQENFDISMSGSLEGIGAVLAEEDHYVRVNEIVPGSASWRQGDLEAGDFILAVAQGVGEPVDVADMPINDVVRLIRGKKGTVVTLTVKKSDERVMVIPITRDIVNIAAAYAKAAIIRHPKVKQAVGYVQLPSFYGNTRMDAGSTPQRNSADDVRRIVSQLRERGVGAIILDLRGNGGGLLNDSREMAGLFIERGAIVQTRDASGEKEVLKDEDPGVAFDGDVVVMVDRFSASAAEIVAGALQDYGRAVIVGTAPTHGKGTVQILVSLDELLSQYATPDKPLGVVKLTRQQFFRITGSSTQHRGVVPDILLPDPADYVESGERYLDSSIPWSSIEPTSFTRWTKKVWDAAQLAEKSRTRQAQDPVFAQVQKRSQLLRTRLDQTKQPLGLDAWRKQRERDEAELKALTPDLEKAPARFSVTEVNYDGTTEPAPRPGSANRQSDKSDSAARWTSTLEKDPWVDEAVRILGDMTGR